MRAVRVTVVGVITGSVLRANVAVLWPRAMVTLPRDVAKGALLVTRVTTSGSVAGLVNSMRPAALLLPTIGLATVTLLIVGAPLTAARTRRRKSW